jgi:hypothetical protein
MSESNVSSQVSSIQIRKSSLLYSNETEQAELSSQKKSQNAPSQVSSIQIRKSSRLFASETELAGFSSQKKSQNVTSGKSTACAVVVDECSSSSSDCTIITNKKEKRPLSIYSSEVVLNIPKKASQKNENKDLEDYSIQEMNDLANNNLFPKKKFLINNNIELYTPILHFFDSLKTFSCMPLNNILFVCKICGSELHASLGYSTNLNKHLNLLSHREKMKDWLEKYEKFRRPDSLIPKLDDASILLVKYIVSSNTAIQQLKNPHFREISRLPVPDASVFRNKWLPNVMEKLIKIIETKLRKAASICLTLDLWSSSVNSDFLALNASLGSEDFDQREIITIGMVRMNDRHIAENIKLNVEKIVNSFDFDKRKISCKFNNMFFIF